MRVRLKSYLKAANFVEFIPVRSVVESRFPLREDIGELEELALSIKSKGLIEPIVVRPLGNKFEIIAGHRRFRACRMNRFVEVPAIIMDVPDREAFEVSLEENIHRKTLDPIEEARAFSIYVNKYGYGSITDLAARIGKSEEYVSHRILLLNLPLSVQSLVSRRLLTASNAWELTRVKDVSKQAELLEVVLRDGLTVAELREAAKTAAGSSGQKEGAAREAHDSRGLVPFVSPTDAEKRAKVKKAASSAVRIAMIRISNLIDSLHEEDRGAKEDLIQFRFKLHGLLDGFAGREPKGDDLESQITSIIRKIFLDNLNSGNLSKFSKLRSKHYTAFGDFPPYTLRNLNQTIIRDARIVKTLHHSSCEIDDLRITRFLGGAIATFRFSYDMTVGDLRFELKSRVSFVFERVEDSWNLVHEHWSPCDLRHEVIALVEQEFTKHKIVPIP
ncbi:MAG: ParB/RepB/Spo0J family partition protein [Thaumarchaeota archaeon]|nr:ParB/RepB/Spo0J family partition protein [Nitrososphaerota archaeon]